MSNYVNSANKNLNMVQRKSLKEYEPKIAESIKKLSDLLGYPITFEWQSTPEQLAKAQNGYDQRAGECCYWHVQGVVDALCEQLADEMTREGFTEKVDKKLFALVPITEDIGYNAQWKIQDGVFRVEYQDEKFANNCGVEWVRDRNKIDTML